MSQLTSLTTSQFVQAPANEYNQVKNQFYKFGEEKIIERQDGEGEGEGDGDGDRTSIAITAGVRLHTSVSLSLAAISA